MTISTQDITGLVLAGGRGSRMGGVDKGLQNFNGSPLALHAVLRLGMQVGEVMVNANRNLAAYESFGTPVWPDADSSYAGPLAGFLTGLERCETPYLLTVPCDTPLFPLDLAERLSQAMDKDDAEIAIVSAPEADEAGQHRAATAAGLLPDAHVAARKPHPLRRPGRPQDRCVDRAAPHGAGVVRPAWRRRRCLRQRQHPGRAAGARSPARAMSAARPPEGAQHRSPQGGGFQ
jgi:molybdenum cofactor guanylyltransferase